jgi:TonB family protein
VRLWLTNLVAYSVQLAALVGTGAVIMAVLRVKVPRATLRFWQVLYLSSVLWPAYQLWVNLDASREVFAGDVLWSVASSGAAGMGAAGAAIAHTRDRRAYAKALLEFSTARPRVLGATALIGRRHLEQRISLIAQDVSMPRSSLNARLAVVTSAVAIATFATASYIPMGARLQAQTERVYKPGEDAGITLPRAVREVKPVYTPEAMQARIQGSVWMRVVVLASGDVGEITVSRSLDDEHGLDQQAINATRQWKFEPGTREGKPVPVEVTIEMTFTLK